VAVELTADRAGGLRSSRRRLARWTFFPGWVAIGIVAVAHALGLTVPVTVRYAVLLVTLVVLGLPHGAADHHSLARALDVELTPRFLGRFCAGYLGLAACYTVVWFVAPAAAFVVFVALTWFHWGQGELYPLATLADGRHLQGPVVRTLTVVVRGGLPMLVPLLFFPERYETVARSVVSLFDPGRTAWLAPLFSADVRLAAGLAFAAVTVSTLSLGLLAAGFRRAWLLDAGETLLLWGFFAVVPPVLAIGVYFATWHSLRHVTRLVELDGVALAALDRGAVVRAAGRFTRDALPATIGALLLFGGLALTVPTAVAGPAEIGGLYLVLLAVLTLPHVVVVSWLDVRQGIWGETAGSTTSDH
jgi:Brp/Blh family beta-carotene 15,15'-monooxygenase